MGKLYCSTALLLVAPHFVASSMMQNMLPHLVLVQHEVYCFVMRHQRLLVTAYEMVDVRTKNGLGWFSTVDGAYTSALFGGLKIN